MIFSIPTVLSSLLFSSLLVSAEPGLSLRVSGEDRVNGVQNLKVIATLTNTGNETLRLFNDPRGVLSRIPTNTFTITNTNGSGPVFNGLVAKYSRKYVIHQFKEESFTNLEPGKNLTIEHDLSEAYNFSAVGPGIFTVEAKNRFFYLDTATNTSRTIYADTGNQLAHRAVVTGQLAVVRRSIRYRPRNVRRAEYASCSEQQQSQIMEGAAVAKIFANDALTAVNNTDSPRYKTWFGKRDDERHTQIVQHFKNLRDNDFTTFSYDCEACASEKDLFAYVYPNEWGTVYLCGAFWNAPKDGTNSRGGTILHEATHFNENAQTEDHAYGQDACKDLAKTDPAKAAKNADSHEYFVENDPPL